MALASASTHHFSLPFFIRASLLSSASLAGSRYDILTLLRIFCLSSLASLLPLLSFLTRASRSISLKVVVVLIILVVTFCKTWKDGSANQHFRWRITRTSTTYCTVVVNLLNMNLSEHFRLLSILLVLVMQHIGLHVRNSDMFLAYTLHWIAIPNRFF